MSAGPSPLVSVLTPFYNTAPYLAECIESVLAQTRGDFEYLLVDNCSTDGSDDIAAGYAARDPRIRFLRNETFLTQLQNYNHALEAIAPHTRYVKIVQADDAIVPQCLADMIALAEAYPRVGLVSSFRLFGRRLYPRLGLSHTPFVMTGREAGRLTLVDDFYMFGSQTTVMYRADIVRARRPFYPEHSTFADAEVALEIMLDHDFGFVPQILSFSRDDDASTWGSVRSFDPILLFEILALHRYGASFLTPDEHSAASAAHEKEYRRFLAECWLRRFPPAFWDYHRAGLATIGRGLRRSDLVGPALAVAADYLLQPKTVGAALLRRLRRRGAPPSSVEPDVRMGSA